MDTTPEVTIVDTEAAHAPRSRRGRRLAIVGSAVGAGTLVTLVVAAGVSTAASGPASAHSTAAPSASAGTHAKGDHKGHPGGPGSGGDVVHGEDTVKKADGTYQVVDTQKGAVTAVSATSISVKSDDGFTATYVVDGTTKVHDSTNKIIGDITVGETVRVVATKSGSAVTATSIGVPGTHPTHAKPSTSAAPAAG